MNPPDAGGGDAVCPFLLNWDAPSESIDYYMMDEPAIAATGEAGMLALPAAAFTALSAYAKTGEEVEGVLIEANLDDCETTPAETVRSLIARAEKAEREREEAVALLEYAKKYVKRAPHDLLMRIDAALAQRGGG